MIKKEKGNKKNEFAPYKPQNPTLFCLTIITMSIGLVMVLVFGFLMFYSLLLYLAGNEDGLILAFFSLIFTISGVFPLVGGIMIFKALFKSDEKYRSSRD